MSHLSTIDCVVMDMEALEAAVGRMGGQIKKQSSYKWYGRFVGDSPLPKGYSVSDLGKCDFAISFPGVNYEVGVVDKGDHYDLIWDYWDATLKNKMGGQKAEAFVQAYAVELAKIEASRQGHVAMEEAEEDGSVTVTIYES